MDAEKKHIYLRVIVEFAIAAVVVLLAVLFGHTVLDILLPFLLAFLMAWILNPVVRALHNKLGLTRKVYSFALVILFYLIVGFLLFQFAILLIEQVMDMARSLPLFISQLQGIYQALLAQVRQLLDKLPAGAEAYEAEFLTALDSAWQWGVSALTGAVSSATRYVSNVAFALPENIIFVTVLILASCFITADFPNLRENIYQRLTPSTQRSVNLLFQSIRAAVTGFFRSQLIFAIIDMSIILMFFFFMKVSYPLPIALALAFLDFLPFFGAGTVIVPWGLICLAVGYWNMGVQLLLLYALLYVLRRVFEPRILGGQTGFSSMQMLVSMYAGMKLYGITGLIIAPIVWIAIVDFCRTGIFGGIMGDLRVITADVRALIARPIPEDIPPKPKERRPIFSFRKRTGKPPAQEEAPKE